MGSHARPPRGMGADDGELAERLLRIEEMRAEIAAQERVVAAARQQQKVRQVMTSQIMEYISAVKGEEHKGPSGAPAPQTTKGRLPTARQVDVFDDTGAGHRPVAGRRARAACPTEDEAADTATRIAAHAGDLMGAIDPEIAGLLANTDGRAALLRDVDPSIAALARSLDANIATVMSETAARQGAPPAHIDPTAPVRDEYDEVPEDINVVIEELDDDDDEAAAACDVEDNEGAYEDDFEVDDGEGADADPVSTAVWECRTANPSTLRKQLEKQFAGHYAVEVAAHRGECMAAVLEVAQETSLAVTSIRTALEGSGHPVLRVTFVAQEF